MKKYVALLRGINVGGRNKLAMANLSKILDSLGCLDIKTYIQSGNVVFNYHKVDTDKLIKSIQKKINKNCGFSPNILVLDSKEFNQAIKNNPFSSKTGKDLHFFFLESIPKNIDLEKLESVKTKTEQFLIKKKVFYLQAPDGIGRSKLASAVEKCVGVSVTTRNFNTVQKLQSLLAGI